MRRGWKGGGAERGMGHGGGTEGMGGKQVGRYQGRASQLGDATGGGALTGDSMAVGGGV